MSSLQSAIIGNVVDLIRVSPSLMYSITQMLDQLERDLATTIMRRVRQGKPLTPYKQAQIDSLLRDAEATILGAFKDIEGLYASRLNFLADLESGKVLNSLNGALGVHLLENKLTPAFLEALAGNRMIQGALSSEWWGLQRESFRNAFQQQMRMGMLRGEGIDSLVKRVIGGPDLPGITTKQKAQAEALVRTSVINMANDVHLETFKANADIIKGIKWVSTLDGRTTIICQGLDGKTWDLNYHPIGHSTLFPGPTAHWNCRSTQVPILYSWKELAQAAGGNKSLAARLDRVPEGTRASMFGPVPANLNYEGWLKSLSSPRREEVMGPVRARMFEQGTLPSSEVRKTAPSSLGDFQAKAQALAEQVGKNV